MNTIDGAEHIDERRSVLLGVTGSVAAYKAAELARELARNGADVHVMMTPAATRFISPLTFEALLKTPVATDLFEGGEAGPIPHVSLAADADALLVAPASADCLARLTHGLADDIVSCTALAFSGPLLLAPAMPRNVPERRTQANIALLRERGAVIIGRNRRDSPRSGKAPAACPPSRR
jgi:phosphopantothenoylcysteine decarboxylase/phosphopantothenate--cysteine ligase